MNVRRTLIIIHAVDKVTNSVQLCVPAWNPDELVSINLDIMPQNVRGFLVPGVILFGYVNTSAETVEQLVFGRIEEQLHFPPEQKS